MCFSYLLLKSRTFYCGINFYFRFLLTRIILYRNNCIHQSYIIKCLKYGFVFNLSTGLGRLEVEQSPTNKHLRRLASSLEDNDCRELLISLGLDTKVLNNLQKKFSPSAFHENDYKYTAMLRWKGIVTGSSFKTIADAFGEIDKHLLCEV